MSMQTSTKTPKRFVEKTHEIKRRTPMKPCNEPNHIYITRKTNVESQVCATEELLNSKYDEVFIHGTGAAINKTLVFAMEVERKFSGSVQSDILTSTVHCTDDIYSLLESDEPITRNRPVSAVHVHLYRSVL